MKTNRNSVSFSVEKEFPKLKVSVSKRGIIDADLEILSIFEWLSLRSKNNNPFETLRAIMLLLKTVKGADVFLDEAIKVIGEPVTLESIREKNNDDYVASVVDIINETSDMFSFIEESDLDIDNIPSPTKKIVLLDIQEYLLLKSNANANKNDDVQSSKEPIKHEKATREVKIKSSSNVKEELDNNNLIDILVQHYNKHKDGKR